MIGSFAKIFLIVNYLVAVALAVSSVYGPVSPLQGSYNWEIVIADKTGPLTYTGGRTIYDYVSGYVRMESWNTADPTPGINGVTLWDLREMVPIVSTIDSNAKCYVQKLNDNNTVPLAPDWSGYTLAKVTYFNRALAEEWTEPFGGVVYVDVFSRDIVGMGNYSTSDDGDSIFYNIQSWSSEKPDGTLFLLPNTIPCQSIAALTAGKKVHTDAVEFKFPNLKCPACKLGIGLILGKLCKTGGAAACSAFPPAIPFCAVLAGLACKAGANLSKDKACKVIHMC
jgi:hypothetical protein